MKVRVKFFAILRERVGTAEMTRDIEEGGTVCDLWRALRRITLRWTCQEFVCFTPSIKTT